MQASKQIKRTVYICSVLGCRKETGYWITNKAENNESEVCWPGHRTETLKPSEDPSALHIYSVCVCSLSLPFSWRQNDMSNVFLCSVLARLYVSLLIIESMKYTLYLGCLGVYWVLFSWLVFFLIPGLGSQPFFKVSHIITMSFSQGICSTSCS